MSFLRSLFSANDAAADSLIVGGGIALATLIGVTVYTVYQDFHVFSPLQFGSGAATILGAVGVGKGARDFRMGGPDAGIDQRPEGQ